MDGDGERRALKWSSCSYDQLDEVIAFASEVSTLFKSLWQPREEERAGFTGS